jgi:hypothetical protein
MEIRFHVDPDTGLPHLFSHGVTEGEVREVLGGIGEDRTGTEGSRVKVGQTAAGRILKIVYVPDPVPGSVCGDGMRSEWKRAKGISKTPTKERAMNDQRLPAGWDAERVQRVLDHYENQTDDEAVAEDEAAFATQGETVMVVPTDLVPEILELLARRRGA